MGNEMIRRPTGTELDKALAERQISTAGLRLNANYTVLESEKQALLAEALRDEREERIAGETALLAGYTKSLKRATWALVVTSVALVLATVTQIVVVLKTH
jgi:hypothetical protein